MADDIKVSAAFVDDEDRLLTLEPGKDSKGSPTQFKAIPVASVDDDSVIRLDSDKPVSDGGPAPEQSLSKFQIWLRGGVPGTAVVSVPLQLDSDEEMDQTVVVNCAVGGGDSTGAAVTLGDPVKQI